MEQHTEEAMSSDDEFEANPFASPWQTPKGSHLDLPSLEPGETTTASPALAEARRAPPRASTTPTPGEEVAHTAAATPRGKAKATVSPPVTDLFQDSDE